MCTCGQLMLMYGRNQHNIVKQLSSNLKKIGSSQTKELCTAKKKKERKKEKKKPSTKQKGNLMNRKRYLQIACPIRS